MVPLKGSPLLPLKCMSYSFTISTFLLLFSSSILGYPLVKRQFQKVTELLESKVQEGYPSDDKAQNADLLVQVKHDKKNWTLYHQGDPSLPVFISFGVGSIGKKIHVLLRGEDYVGPFEPNVFVVLRQTSKSDTYSLHKAYISDMGRIKQSKVYWYEARVEQKKKVIGLIQYFGDKDVRGAAIRSRRPECDWVGYLLLCESTRDVPPLRGERPGIEPQDAEDAEPVNTMGDADDYGEGTNVGFEPPGGGDFNFDYTEEGRKLGGKKLKRNEPKSTTSEEADPVEVEHEDEKENELKKNGVPVKAPQTEGGDGPINEKEVKLSEVTPLPMPDDKKKKVAETHETTKKKSHAKKGSGHKKHKKKHEKTKHKKP